MFLGEFERAEKQLSIICPESGAPSDDCLGNRVPLLIARGRTVEAKVIFDGLQAKYASGYGKVDYGYVAADYIKFFEDIPTALKYARLSLRGNCMHLKYPLWRSRRGALLPEVVSTDPQWLAFWQEPKLRPLMDEYHKNLVAFRKGG